MERLLIGISLRNRYANCAANSPACNSSLGRVCFLSGVTRDLAHNNRVIIVPSLNAPPSYAAAPNALSGASPKMCGGIDDGSLSLNMCP